MGRLCFQQGAGPAWSYSLGLLPDVDETNLSEPAGIAILPGPIDWNLDGDSTDTGVSINLQGDVDSDGNQNIDVQTDNDDWAMLQIKVW